MNAKKDKLRQITNQLIEYKEELVKDEGYSGIIERGIFFTSLKNKREVMYLVGNTATLVSIAIRIFLVAIEKEGNYHLDKYSGELDDNTEELIIKRKEKSNKYNIEKY